MTVQSDRVLWGRKFDISLKMPADQQGGREIITLASDSFDPEPLRVTFDVETYAWRGAVWYADVTVYNLDQETTEKIVSALEPVKTNSTPGSQVIQGMELVIQAGYQKGNYGQIWSGPVFQPLWQRENVVDFKLTLHCIMGLLEDVRSSIAKVYTEDWNQVSIIKDIIQQAYKGTPLKVPDNIQNKTFPRGKGVFGSPAKYLTQFAEDNGLQWWKSDRGVEMDSASAVSNEPAIVYTPVTGLVGSIPQEVIVARSPEITLAGIHFQTLLDPRLKVMRPLMQVKIDNSSIVRLKRIYGQYPTRLDQDGVYAVYGVRYTGDTRGNDWYCSVTGVTPGDALEAAGRAF